MNIFFRSALYALALAALTSMTSVSPLRPAPQEKSLHVATFDEALRDCRVKQPGRINRRLNLRVDSPYVAACLRRSGREAHGEVETRVASMQHPIDVSIEVAPI